MAQIFPKWTNRLPSIIVAGSFAFLTLASLAAGYYFSPEYTDVGYRPRQPVPFSHKLHAGELEMDCRYCHTTVEVSTVASVPPTQTCMNCHRLVGQDSEELQPVRESAELGEPIHWIRVHQTPDYAYFNHSVHIRAGVGCSSCHGDVSGMEQIMQVRSLSMKWCLECHRNPSLHLRSRSQITLSEWEPLAAPEVAVDASTDCTACHR